MVPSAISVSMLIERVLIALQVPRRAPAADELHRRNQDEQPHPPGKPWELRIGAQVTMVAPAASAMNAAARRIASASTPPSAIITRVFMV